MLRMLTLGSIVMLASAAALGLPADSDAYYGGPRFYNSQPSVINRLLHNVAGEEYIVTSAAGTPALQIVQVQAAVTAWNNALRSAPNSITKYPLHYNGPADPAANIVVRFANRTTIDAECAVHPVVACNGTEYPVSTIWILQSAATTRLVTHELGHSLWYEDYYNSDKSCVPTYQTVMDCDDNITDPPDEVDFQSHYEPTYQSADNTYPDTWSSSWNAVYQVGSTSVVFPVTTVDHGYYWEKRSDTPGSLLASGYTPLNENSKSFDYSLGSRYCSLSKIYNEVGYPGTRPWSPRSQYSCIGAAQSQSAGFLLSTSDRFNSSQTTLNIRARNFAGGTRNVGIFGYPNFNDIGCGYQNLVHLATRECYVPLARGAYDRLAWYAWDGGLLSWGYLDFE